jgi:hypothetical protein
MAPRRAVSAHSIVRSVTLTADDVLGHMGVVVEYLHWSLEPALHGLL